MRRKHEIVCGRPISVWECKGFADRYTVVYLDEVDERGNVQMVGMSGAPFHPQGVCMHGEMPLYNVAYKGRGGVFDKRIRFADLPEDCRKVVERDLTPQKEE